MNGNARPDAAERQRRGELQLIGAKCLRWAVLYGTYTHRFRPIAARTASELLGLIRAAERSHHA